ncbi:hypothetical protein IG631_13176 [Alternaria alternata]|nr:hypothetical protein IG631_13176 [Alternaria alternata]
MRSCKPKRWNWKRKKRPLRKFGWSQRRRGISWVCSWMRAETQRYERHATNQQMSLRRWSTCFKIEEAMLDKRRGVPEATFLVSTYLKLSREGSSGDSLLVRGCVRPRSQRGHVHKAKPSVVNVILSCCDQNIICGETKVELARTSPPSAKSFACLIGGRNRVSASCHLRHAALGRSTTTFLIITIGRLSL